MYIAKENPAVMAKTFGKIKTANAIFWIYLGGTVNKTFLFFKIESSNFEVQFKIEFRET